MKVKAKVIGTGGIGLCLLPPLCRVLNYGSTVYSFDEVEMALIDGDAFEEKNKDRQDFRRRGNKAEATVAELEDVYPNIYFRAHPTYIDDGNIGVLLKDGDTIFLCVDNHKTRNLVSRFCEKELKNVTLISGGNNFTDGNVMVYIREDGKNVTLPLHATHTPDGKQYHPEIADPQDKHPNEIEQREGCLELIASAPQLLVANNMAAAMMLNAYHGFLTKNFHGGNMGLFQFDDAHFDIRSCTARALRYSPQNKTKKGK